MHKAAEEALRESEERYRTLVECTLDGIVIHSGGRVVFANGAAAAMLGFAGPAALVGQPLASTVHPDDLARSEDRIRRVLAGETVAYPVEARCVKQDGTELPVECTAALVTYDGEPAILTVIRNITERRRVEEVDGNSRSLLEATLEATDNGILVVGREGAVVKANGRFAEMWRVPGDILALGNDEALIAHILNQLFDPDAFLAKVESLYGDPSAVSVDLLHLRDGRVFERTSKPMLVGGEPQARVWSFLDITDRKRFEEERDTLQAKLHQIEKAESLGRMAGAIAHHYNNLLGAVLLNLELAQSKLPSDAGAGKYLADATKASQRAAEISQQMLSYLGQEKGRRVPTDLCATCREVLPPLRAALPGNARLKSEFPVEGAVIRADALQLKRVLTYLAANAGEAVGEWRGSVTVAIAVIPAADIHASRFFPAGWEPKAETYACLSVADTGCGMTPEILDKAFDPFFSTKFTGRGLGLPVVMGIVQSHEGACAVESSPGQGTTIRVFLPVIAEQPLQRRTAGPAGSGSVEGRGLVLVVEDEPMLRDLTRTVLENIGYQVVEAADGAAAVEVFRQHQDQIRCVLCDLTMPRLDGWATLKALRSLRPDVAVILTSGYDEAQVLAGEHAERPQAFLHKPYASADLEAALAAALGMKVSP